MQKQVETVEVPSKKENAMLEQHIEILDWYHANGRNQSKTAKHFATRYPNLCIKQQLVSAWVKNEKKWQEDYEQSGSSDKSAKRVCQTQHPEVTEMMDLWVLKALGDGILLTGEVLHQKWSKFADMVCIPDDERLHLSSGWLASFKDRHNLKEMKCHGKAGSADEEVVESEWERIKTLSRKKVMPGMTFSTWTKQVSFMHTCYGLFRCPQININFQTGCLLIKDLQIRNILA